METSLPVYKKKNVTEGGHKKKKTNICKRSTKIFEYKKKTLRYADRLPNRFVDTYLLVISVHISSRKCKIRRCDNDWTTCDARPVFKTLLSREEKN